MDDGNVTPDRVAELQALIHEFLAAAAMEGAEQGAHTYEAAKALTRKRAHNLAARIAEQEASRD